MTTSPTYGTLFAHLKMESSSCHAPLKNLRPKWSEVKTALGMNKAE